MDALIDLYVMGGWFRMIVVDDDMNRYGWWICMDKDGCGWMDIYGRWILMLDMYG